jgi:hypothetical protein
MALANVAWILASNGQRVLVIDWDLETPGIHRFFRPFLQDPDLTATAGLIDFLIQFCMDAASGPGGKMKSILHYAASLDYAFPGEGTIDFVGAGQQNTTYPIRVNGFNWQNFYEYLGGHELLQTMKVELGEYDYVLIDSRTGVSDYAGICTLTLPDTLVVCFTLNWQSVQGSAGIVDNVFSQRLAAPPAIYPVPMRVEYGEKEMLERARAEARQRFSPFVRPHLGDEYWGLVEFPYVPFYTYNEIPAVFVDMPQAVGSVLRSAEKLTAYLTDGRVEAARLMSQSERATIRHAYDNRTGSGLAAV